jgi:hypothetical protein
MDPEHHEDSGPPGILTGQALHFTCLALLLVATGFGWERLGRPFPGVFWTAVAVPVVHQLFVWLAWRVELRRAGVSASLGFGVYLVVFFLLFGGRFVSLAALAWSDRGSLDLPAVPRAVFTALLSIPGLYAGYSVRRYFGLARAAGADHFDPRYREMPFVRRGIFRFTRNGMYTYAFLLFWAIALGFGSSAALLVAAFSHAYIWVHFHATEKPDMRYLYGPS